MTNALNFPCHNLVDPVLINTYKNMNPKVILSSYDELQKFFQNSPDISWIVAQAKYVCSLDQFKDATYPLQDKQLNQKLSRHHTYLYRIAEITNDPNPYGNIIEKFSQVKERDISDYRVKKRVFTSHRRISFSCPDGMCGALCNWFGYTYLNTRKHFPDPRAHMIVLGELFKMGGGAEATFLHQIDLRKGSLLNLKLGKQKAHTITKGGEPRSVVNKTVQSWQKNEKIIVHKLQSLRHGFYKITSPDHAIVYLKINRRLGFFMEPNEGIIEIHGRRQGEALRALVTESLEEDLKLSDHLRFIPITLRNTENGISNK